MKPRPRSVEREVAARMSVHFGMMGLSPVERIPVLGRTGPDLDINESRLAIDVKSRKSVPLGVMVESGICSNSYGLLFVRLCDFLLLYSDLPISEDHLFPSKVVNDWYVHMKTWADIHDAIPALVVHRPGLMIDRAVFVVSASDQIRMKETYRLWQDERLKS